MPSFDSEVFDYLHDADIVEIRLTCTSDGCRDLTIALLCDADTGSLKWNRKKLVFHLHDIVLSSHVVVGAMQAPEKLNSWTEEISPALQRDLVANAAFGLLSTGQQFCLRFHSGSVLEGVCRELQLEL